MIASSADMKGSISVSSHGALQRYSQPPETRNFVHLGAGHSDPNLFVIIHNHYCSTMHQAREDVEDALEEAFMRDTR